MLVELAVDGPGVYRWQSMEGIELHFHLAYSGAMGVSYEGQTFLSRQSQVEGCLLYSLQTAQGQLLQIVCRYDEQNEKILVEYFLVH